MPFRDTPIRKKLMVIFMLISGVVVLLTCGAFVANELLTFKDKAFQGLTTLGDVIAVEQHRFARLRQRADATEVLSALKARPQIVAAALYDRNGKLFARYPATRPRRIIQADARQPTAIETRNSILVGYLPVVQGDNIRLGTLYLASNKTGDQRSAHPLRVARCGGHDRVARRRVSALGRAAGTHIAPACSRWRKRRRRFRSAETTRCGRRRWGKMSSAC